MALQQLIKYREAATAASLAYFGIQNSSLNIVEK